MGLIRNNICVCQVLVKPILALEVDSKIFDEVLKPILDADSSEIIVWLVFNLDDNSPIKKKTRINLSCE
jgi:hypothetical protein